MWQWLLFFWLQNILEFQYQYEDSDVLNMAVSGAKTCNLTREATNLVNQLRKLNDVRIFSHPHTFSIKIICLARLRSYKHCTCNAKSHCLVASFFEVCLLLYVFYALSRLVWLTWRMTGSYSLFSLEEMTYVTGKLHVLPQSYVHVHKPMLSLCDLMDCLLNYPDTSLIPRLMHKSMGTSCINMW